MYHDDEMETNEIDKSIDDEMANDIDEIIEREARGYAKEQGMRIVIS